MYSKYGRKISCDRKSSPKLLRSFAILERSDAKGESSATKEEREGEGGGEEEGEGEEEREEE